MAWRGSVTPRVIASVFAFGLFALVVQWLSDYLKKRYQFDLGIEQSPFELAGAVLGLLLVFRTNSSYDRWWEARKLWGGIVNQCRNLVIIALSYGPRDAQWRKSFVCWVAVFAHVCRSSLRAEPPCEKVLALVGPEVAAQIAASQHMPNFVAFKLGQMLQDAVSHHGMEPLAFAQADRERTDLINHIGGCERILKTPLPLVYVIKMRRFIVLFLLTLPLALLHKLQSSWLIPLVTMGVAYPVMSLDQIGAELQNPFSAAHLSHLPLDDISANIDKNVHALLAQSELPDGLSPHVFLPNDAI